MRSFTLCVRDLEAINFDKVALLTVHLVHVLKVPLDAIQVVTTATPDDETFIVDAFFDRVWPEQRRSLTEVYALQKNLGTADAHGALIASEVRGLPSLCHALAKNHGKVSGIRGGHLYQKGLVPNVARNLPLLKEEAPTLILKLIKAIGAILDKEDFEDQFFALSTTKEWTAISDRLSRAEQAVYTMARKMAVEMQANGECDGAHLFNLNKGRNGELGLFLETRDPNLMKHMWAALNSLQMPVAVALVCHPDTGRVAILTAKDYGVNLKSVVETCEASWQGAKFDFNASANRLIWDPRFSTEIGPTSAELKSVVTLHATTRAPRNQVTFQAPSGMRASIGDLMKAKGPEVITKRN